VITPNPFGVWFPQPEIGSILRIKEFCEESVAFELSLAGCEVVRKSLSSAAIPAIAA
jgi:hypothetical protein